MSEKEFRKLIGERIRDMRKRYGIKQKDLCEMVGISSSHLCDIENGRKAISAFLLQKIEKALGHTVWGYFL